jgi:hypothetical protein
VRAGVLALVLARIRRAAALSLAFFLLASVPGWAQTPLPPPLPGFVPPYEITRIVRSAGFAPLAPPLREGTTYVIRATDFRGILMRVVVDARSGAIRAVNRIVSDAGAYSALGMLPPPYGVQPPYSGPPAYAPPEFELPEVTPSEAAGLPAAAAPVAIHPPARPLLWEPPLPRPRPPALSARKAAADAKPSVKPAEPAVTAAPAAPATPKQSPTQLPD